jgi:hypothetical protein
MEYGLTLPQRGLHSLRKEGPRGGVAMPAPEAPTADGRKTACGCLKEKGLREWRAPGRVRAPDTEASTGRGCLSYPGREEGKAAPDAANDAILGQGFGRLYRRAERR